MLFACVLAACATTSPAAAPALNDAHAAVQRLEADPMAAQVAGKPLEDARAALVKADDANAKHRSADEVIHWSYMASRNADVGQAALREGRARAEMQQAQAQRDQMLLAKREQEADQAKAQLQAMNSQNSEMAAQLQALQAKQTDRGMVLTLGNSVLFDTDSDTLKPGGIETLHRVGEFMRSNPSVNIRVEGYTDSTGTNDYNQALSQRRADAVARELRKSDVPSDRIDTVGRGEDAPVASNSTASGRQQNRRVEIIFSNDRGAFLGSNR